MMKLIIKNGIASGDSVYGVFYLEINEKYFPSKDWEDFIVPLVIDWRNITLQFIKSHKKQEELLFMDGNYGLKLTKKMHNIEIKCVKLLYSKEEAVVMIVEIGQNEWMDILTNALKRCEDLGYIQ